MSFKDKLSSLANTVSKFAPMLGGVIGGPPGAAVGAVIASVFGGDSNDPEGLEKLIKADPDAAVKLKAIEANNKVELEKLMMQKAANDLAADTARLESVNSTMRVEAGSGDKWQRRWRPFWGFITGIAFFLQILVIMYAIVIIPLQAPGIIVALASLDIFWAVPLAILGVSAYHRGKEKRVLAGENIKPLINFKK
jgi:hypothetical protein